MNLVQVSALKDRLKYLRERICAGQIDTNDLFFSMQGFDYSMVSPLVNSGNFHLMLGHEKVSQYFSFVKFFNNQNAEVLNSMLKTEHESKTSLDYLKFLERQVDDLTVSYKKV